MLTPFQITQMKHAIEADYQKQLLVIKQDYLSGIYTKEEYLIRLQDEKSHYQDRLSELEVQADE